MCERVSKSVLKSIKGVYFSIFFLAYPKKRARIGDALLGFLHECYFCLFSWLTQKKQGPERGFYANFEFW